MKVILVCIQLMHTVIIIARVTGSENSRSLVHSHGVKSRCVLNDISGFHAVQNFNLEIMHIVLELIVPFELSCVLFYLCNHYQAVSISEINGRVHSFWSVINVENATNHWNLTQSIDLASCIRL